MDDLCLVYSLFFLWFHCHCLTSPERFPLWCLWRMMFDAFHGHCLLLDEFLAKVVPTYGLVMEEDFFRGLRSSSPKLVKHEMLIFCFIYVCYVQESYTERLLVTMVRIGHSHCEVLGLILATSLSSYVSIYYLTYVREG